ncbi:PAS domain-containing protein [Mucilaginibacter sp. E4BP6]|uniref:PAS domain-containing protein n=1 Tax=Mucilaginibacter sp. E4BP6 TaxID=2723089 RepID=UPI0018002C58|nr:PAS domain-containing protein [Mucilaginibacter sp. E4BP6]NYE67827.1 PAS domain S-box-containing protein [Mucilaginibacter sp. E4BP6]
MTANDQASFNDFPFLAGGGAMGELIRSINWSANSLGEPSDWPLALQQSVSMMLTTSFPVLICWGGNYIQLYNDAFRPINGETKHPQAMGGSAKDTYAEIWEQIGPMFQSVMQGQTIGFPNFMVPLDRNGFVEDCYFDFAYSPIRDSKGVTGGILVICMETTEKVKAINLANQAQAAVAGERDRLTSFFMQAPAGICILSGPQLVYELVNPAYQQLLPGRKLLNRPIFEALPELVGTPLEQVLLNVYRTGEPFEINELLIPVAEHEGGPTLDRYFTFNYQARHDENDQVDGILVFVFEVTSMKNVQEDLREARERSDQQKRIYEAISSGTPDLMYMFDLDYRFTYANNSLLSMWGKTEENAIGKGLLENGYEPWHAEMHEREIDQIKVTKQPVRGEVSFPHAILGKRVYDYILTPVFNEQGEVTAVAGITRDVSERKELEEALADSSEELQAINEEMSAVNEEQAASNEELRSTNEELAVVNEQLLEARQKIEESETALRLAIEAANFGTWFIHSVTREFITDARLKELFGYYPDEDLSIEQALAQITDEYRGYVAAKLENAIYRNGDYDVTYSVIGLHDNQLRWLRAIGNLKVDPSGAFSAFTGMVMDITEQKQDEIRKNDFIGMVSHELKTPLTSLTAIVQVANLKLKDSEDSFLAGAMEKASVQVKRMATMINGFLNVSRLESAKLIIDKRKFNLEELIEETIQETEMTITSHVFKFEPCNPVMINADHDKIGAVITNLISNAVKYSPKGKKVDIKCEVIGGRAQVSVKDEGMGLKPQDKERVFERYYRVETDHTQHISGFGIGLYLSAEIIHRHDGEIWVESESGKGSTFYFSLPL